MTRATIDDNGPRLRLRLRPRQAGRRPPRLAGMGAFDASRAFGAIASVLVAFVGWGDGALAQTPSPPMPPPVSSPLPQAVASASELPWPASTWPPGDVDALIDDPARRVAWALPLQRDLDRQLERLAPTDASVRRVWQQQRLMLALLDSVPPARCEFEPDDAGPVPLAVLELQALCDARVASGERIAAAATLRQVTAAYVERLQTRWPADGPEALRAARSSLDLATPARMRAQLRADVGPLLQRGGEVGPVELGRVLDATVEVLARHPAREALRVAYDQALEALAVRRAREPAGREAAPATPPGLPAAPARAEPVKGTAGRIVVASWGAGVETMQFRRQRIVDELGQPMVYGHDLQARRDDSELPPAPAAAATAAAGLEPLAVWRGEQDLAAGRDSAEARRWREALATLDADALGPVLAALDATAQRVRDTHAASVMLEAVPSARLLVGREAEAGSTAASGCTSVELARRQAAAAADTVAFLRRQVTRVVLVGWQRRVDDEALALARCQPGVPLAERREQAERIVAAWRQMLVQAMRASPSMLFVVAGESGPRDAVFQGDVPAGLAAPNLLRATQGPGSGPSSGPASGPSTMGASAPAAFMGEFTGEREGVLPGGGRIALQGPVVTAAALAAAVARAWSDRPQATPAEIAALFKPAVVAPSAAPPR